MNYSSLILTLGLLAATALPVAARIRCDGDFQIVEGREVATPYCSDQSLVRVAREHGDDVSGRDVRANPGLKAGVCRFVGSSPSISSDCADSED